MKEYNLEVVFDHILVCETRFKEIKTAKDFNDTDYGNMILDSIVTRLQSIGENLKRAIKNNPSLPTKYPEIEWEKIIKFRDFFRIIMKNWIMKSSLIFASTIYPS